MNDERRRVLDLLAQGKITVDEADQLLAALGPSASSTTNATDTSAKPEKDAPAQPRYLRIAVHKQATDHHGEKDVTMRVPIGIVKGGVRLGAMIKSFGGQRFSTRLRDSGAEFDLSQIDPAMLDAIIREMGELHIDVDSGRAQVRITCE